MAKKFVLVLVMFCLSSWPILSQSQSEELDSFFEYFFREFITRDPEWMTQLGDLTIYGIESQNDQLTQRSEAAWKERVELYQEALGFVKKMEGNVTLRQQEQISLQVLKWYLEDQIAADQFLDQDYAIDHFFGLQNSLPNLMSKAPLENKEDAEDYLMRLAQFGMVFDQVIAKSTARAKKQMIPPKVIIKHVGSQCRKFISADVKENPLYTVFATKVQQMSGLTDLEKDKLIAQAGYEVEEIVYPAYERLLQHSEELASQAYLKAGVWELPNGDEYYQYLLRHYTTTNMTPEEIHNLGLQEVERIKEELLTVLKEMGFKYPRLAIHLRRVPTEVYSSEEEIFGKYEEIISEMEARLPEMFGLLPTAEVILEPVPALRAASTSASMYSRPAIDGSRPGIFYVNMNHPHREKDMYALAYHEAIPGHHLQLAIQSELKGLPTIRNLLTFTGYTEGWALYAEKLADEYGFYQTPAQRIGYLQSELFRAARLVIDTGIHYKRWSRQQALTYLSRTTGNYWESEIDRYILMPGQACAYKVGELKLIQLRQKAEQALGGQFDLKEFHNVILQNGAVPLEIVEEEVMRYIESKR